MFLQVTSKHPWGLLIVEEQLKGVVIGGWKLVAFFEK